MKKTNYLPIVLLLLVGTLFSLFSCSMVNADRNVVTNVSYSSKTNGEYKFTLTYDDGKTSEIELPTDDDAGKGDSKCEHDYGSWFQVENQETLSPEERFSFRLCANCGAFEWEQDGGRRLINVQILDGESGWKTVDSAPAFDCMWEPGFIVAKVLKIEDPGVLAYGWEISLVPESEVSIIAEVLDVYVCRSEAALSHPVNSDLSDYEKIGTLEELLEYGFNSLSGILLSGESEYVSIVFKMQESAGNEYQNVTLCPISVQIVAYQLSAEEDNFGSDYDA